MNEEEERFLKTPIKTMTVSQWIEYMEKISKIEHGLIEILKKQGSITSDFFTIFEAYRIICNLDRELDLFMIELERQKLLAEIESK